MQVQRLTIRRASEGPQERRTLLDSGSKQVLLANAQATSTPHPTQEGSNQADCEIKFVIAIPEHFDHAAWSNVKVYVKYGQGPAEYDVLDSNRNHGTERIAPCWNSPCQKGLPPPVICDRAWEEKNIEGVNVVQSEGELRVFTLRGLRPRFASDSVRAFINKNLPEAEVLKEYDRITVRVTTGKRSDETTLVIDDYPQKMKTVSCIAHHVSNYLMAGGMATVRDVLVAPECLDPLAVYLAKSLNAESAQNEQSALGAQIDRNGAMLWAQDPDRPLCEGRKYFFTLLRQFAKRYLIQKSNMMRNLVGEASEGRLDPAARWNEDVAEHLEQWSQTARKYLIQKSNKVRNLVADASEDRVDPSARWNDDVAEHLEQWSQTATKYMRHTAKSLLWNNKICIFVVWFLVFFLYPILLIRLFTPRVSQSPSQGTLVEERFSEICRLCAESSGQCIAEVLALAKCSGAVAQTQQLLYT